ncbi:MAG: FG-GAP-like repeat-containing protein, partial [Cyclobacteriaceae bacterium]|nr:FG-GAP-like repeat-containing protein [Cyclobacteriaceae bacterium]
EWSWGGLIFDMNNDGLRDIFISNGIFKDLLDRDYLDFAANEENIRNMLNRDGKNITDLIDLMPSHPVPNFAYKNEGNFKFVNVAEDWGLGKNSFSNGSAYGDLDNDGDLDLVVSNVNMASGVYRNNTDTAQYRSFQILLSDNFSQNRFAIGAKISAYYNGKTFFAENYPSRGFESSVDYTIHIGLGDIHSLDSIVITWPVGEKQVLYNVRSNQKLLIEKEKGLQILETARLGRNASLIESDVVIPFKHIENEFVDFDRDRLLPAMLHNSGPFIATEDVNADQLKDIYVGGAKDSEGGLFIQTENGFVFSPQAAFTQDKLSEDTDIIFFDCDQDGDQDLYVASGGRAFSSSSSALSDRLYLNDGKGNFSDSSSSLPFGRYVSTSVVANSDYDGDGDQDLFVGERFKPFQYGSNVSGFIFENNGKGIFTDVTAKVCPDLMDMPMITDARWVDINGDSETDLVVSTEWGMVFLFINKNGKLLNVSSEWKLDGATGWWNVILPIDIDLDGDIDIVAGNHGKNSFFKDSTRMYLSDFDNNGTIDQLICYRMGNKYYTVADRNELVAQIPGLKKKILHFSDYATMDVEELLGRENLEASKILDAHVLESSVFINEGGYFKRVALPDELQLAPIYAVKEADVNNDNIVDLVFGGNQYLVKPQFGRYDALPLTIFFGSKDMIAKPKIEFAQRVGQVRDIEIIRKDNKDLYIIGINDGPIKIFETKK